MIRYGDVMDKLIDGRVNYLLRKRTANKGKLEKLLDNKDISVESLQSNEKWDFKECKDISFWFIISINKIFFYNFKFYIDKKFLKYFAKFQRKSFYVYNHFLTLVCSESNATKEKIGYNVFFIMSSNTLQISYDVICEAIRIQEIKLAEEHKSKNQYLEVKVFLENEKNK